MVKSILTKKKSDSDQLKSVLQLLFWLTFVTFYAIWSSKSHRIFKNIKLRAFVQKTFQIWIGTNWLWVIQLSPYMDVKSTILFLLFSHMMCEICAWPSSYDLHITFDHLQRLVFRSQEYGFESICSRNFSYLSWNQLIMSHATFHHTWISKDVSHRFLPPFSPCKVYNICMAWSLSGLT